MHFIDQLGRSVVLSDYPSRIISTVPSQTELLHFLGLDNNVVGITKFCIHPEEWRSKRVIGGTKKLKIDIIESLDPDLVIANKEENIKEQIDVLASKYPVYISDVENLPSALDMILAIGKMTNTEEKALQLISEIQSAFIVPDTFQEITSAYLIWKNPYMTVGYDTFIHDIMNRFKLKNVFGDLTRYPVISIEDIVARHPQILLLSSEPFPFKQKDVEEISLQLPGTKLFLVDGEMFSWYGSRLLKAATYLKTLLQEIRSALK